MFVQKDEKTIRQEVVDDLKGNNNEWKEEDHKETIDRITQRRLKDEETKASLHKQKTKRREMLEANNIDLETGKPKEIKKPESKEIPDPKEDDNISADDRARFYGAGGSRKEMSFIKEVMTLKKCDFDAAWKSETFKIMKAENDKKIDKIKAQRNPNRGGGHKQKETEEEKNIKEYGQNLPPGFSAEKPNLNK